MKTFKHLSVLVGLILTSSAIFTNCKKEKEAQPVEQEFTFAINLSATQSNARLKSALERDLSDVKKIILTIQHADGSPTNYTLSELKIFQMNGNYFSQRLVLKTGSYNLTEFLLLDSAGNTVFATPYNGSQQAQFVSYPLPVAFDVSKDISTPVNMDVINTENKVPANFGFVSFPINPRKGIYFKMAIVDMESGELIPGKLSVYDLLYNSLYRENTLDASTNNLVIIDTAYSSCNLPCLVISKEGYIPCKKEISRDSLKLFNETPMLIELKKNEYETGEITDIDENTYKTVKIGAQWWMAEDLIVTRFADGTEIPYVDRTDYQTWEELTPNAVAHTGRGFYTWAAATKKLPATTDKKIQGVCPAGWHLPSDGEWRTLVNYLTSNGYGYGGNPNAIGKAIAIDSHMWVESNIPGHVGCLSSLNNCVGFSGLPKGQRFVTGNWEENNYAAHWWTATTGSDTTKAYSRQLYFNKTKLESYISERNNGYNVRCIKN